jgi:hypothetical protein
MRILLTALIGAFCLAAASPMAAAMSRPAGASWIPSASNLLPAASTAKKCAHGQHWVAGAYAKHGKYRAGHCAPN